MVIFCRGSGNDSQLAKQRFWIYAVFFGFTLFFEISAKAFGLFFGLLFGLFFGLFFGFTDVFLDYFLDLRMDYFLDYFLDLRINFLFQ